MPPTAPEVVTLLLVSFSFSPDFFLEKGCCPPTFIWPIPHFIFRITALVAVVDSRQNECMCELYCSYSWNVAVIVFDPTKFVVAIPSQVADVTVEGKRLIK